MAYKAFLLLLCSVLCSACASVLRPRHESFQVTEVPADYPLTISTDSPGRQIAEFTVPNEFLATFGLFRCEVSSNRKMSFRLSLTEPALQRTGVSSQSAPMVPDTQETLAFYVGPLPVKKEFHFRLSTAATTVEFIPQVPGGQLTIHGCKFVLMKTDRLDAPEPLIPERLNYQKGSRTRIIALGGSTMYGQGGSWTIPMQLQLLLEAKFPGRFEIMNAGIHGASISDFYFNWFKHQKTDRDGTFFSHLNLYSATAPLNKALFPYATMDWGLSTLEPDALILAPMWNDVFSQLWLRTLAENTRVVAGPDGIPLATRMVSARRYLYMKNQGDDASIDPLLLFNHYATLSTTSPDGLDARTAMTNHHYGLLKEFVTMVRSQRPNLPIILIAFPFAVNESFSQEMQDRLMRHGFKNWYNHKLGDTSLAYWSAADDAQRASLARVAAELPAVYFVDASKKYRDWMQDMHPASVDELYYYASDLMHSFTYGNSFLAQELDSKIGEVFIDQ